MQFEIPGGGRKKKRKKGREKGEKGTPVSPSPPTSAFSLDFERMYTSLTESRYSASFKANGIGIDSTTGSKSNNFDYMHSAIYRACLSTGQPLGIPSVHRRRKQLIQLRKSNLQDKDPFFRVFVTYLSSRFGHNQDFAIMVQDLRGLPAECCSRSQKA